MSGNVALVAPRMRRVSRNMTANRTLDFICVAPRMRRVSRNAGYMSVFYLNVVAPRMRRVSRNSYTAKTPFSASSRASYEARE